MALVERLKAQLDHPALYNLTQLLVSGRQLSTRRHLRRALRLQPGDALLDVCCGTGGFAAVAPGPYLGIDLNPHYIAYARRQHGAGAGRPEREFIVGDVAAIDFVEQGQRWAQAMMVNSLHHLNDDESARVLDAVSKVTVGGLVVIDMDPWPGNPISRLLAGLDRGSYIRPLSEQVTLLSRSFRVVRAFRYYDGLCGQTCLVGRARGATSPQERMQ